MAWEDLDEELHDLFAGLNVIDQRTRGGSSGEDGSGPVVRGRVSAVSYEASIEASLRMAVDLERYARAQDRREEDAVLSTPQGRKITRDWIKREQQQRYETRMASLGRNVPIGPRCAKGYCKAPPMQNADGKVLKLCEKHTLAQREAVKKSKKAKRTRQSNAAPASPV